MLANLGTLRSLIVASALGCLASACQIPGLDRMGGRESGAERASRQSSQGDHAAAARSYEAAARTAAADGQNSLWLQAASEWATAGDAAAAETAIGMLVPPITTPQAQERVRIRAEIAVARGETQRAVALMREIPESGDASALATRARILFSANRVQEAVASLVARDHLLTNATARAANQRLILDGISAAQNRGADTRPPADADSLVAGWLELGRIVADARAGALGVQRRVQIWRSRYPAHPASDELWRRLPDASTGGAELPRQIALLLPLSGRAEAAGIAVRDGFLGAYYEQPAGSRPRLRIYDVAARDAPSSYLQAIADGSDFVVGPLTREEVSGLAMLADGRATTLALNFLPDGVAVPERFYQFALSPEDEARLVARRAVADGRFAGLSLAPQTDWGRRVQAAFAAELFAAGGQLVDQAYYSPDTSDFNELLRGLLRTSGQRGSTPRPDASFIFVAAQPLHGRLIRTQLRFNYASALPVYALSDIYDPQGTSNVDLDGVIFPDMPWVLDPYGAAAAARESALRFWPERAGQLGRLHAFGYDAFHLVGRLRRLRGPDSMALPGLTGRLDIDRDGRIHRELDWVQVVDGKPVLLPDPGSIIPAT